MALQGLIGYKSLDVNSIVSKLMSAERAPIADMNTRVATLNSKITTINRLQSYGETARTSYSKLKNMSASATADTVKTAVKDFVSAYNNFAAQGKAMTAKGQPLQGDSQVIRTQADLRLQISQSYSSGSLNGLRDLGISIAKDGQLSLDESKLDTALAAGTTDAIGVLKDFGNRGYGRIDRLVAFDGVLKGKVSNMQGEISRIDARKERLEDRLVSVEKRYYTEFSKADEAISRMNGGSSISTYA